MKKKYRNIIIVGIALFIFAGLIFKICTPKKKVDVSEGKKRLEEMSNREITEIEKVIRARDEQEEKTEEELKNRTPNEKMKNALVMGDSRTEALKEYRILENVKVISQIGIELDATDEQIDEAISRNPQYVFLAYGLNDLEATYGDREVFKEQYRRVIEKLKQGLPDAKIYVNTILGVQEKAIKKNSYLNYIEDFNAAIRELCTEENVGCIEVGDLGNEEMYEPDGEHLKAAYYPLWIDKMTEAAGI